VAQPSLLGQEAGAQALMKQRFADLGLDVRELAIDEAALRDHPGYSPSIVSYDGRVNVIGVHRPRQATGRSLILNGHIDVVPVGAERLWTRPPFEPWVDGDRLHGRGSNDMKAGIVAYTMALQALRRLGWQPAAEVIVQSVIEEECTGNGALACLLAGYTADAAIIPEPGDEVMSAQMGVMWMTLDVYGVPVHAAVAHTGIGAIDFAQHLVGRLRELEAQWNQPQHRHGLYCAARAPGELQPRPHRGRRVEPARCPRTAASTCGWASTRASRRRRCARRSRRCCARPTPRTRRAQRQGRGQLPRLPGRRAGGRPAAARAADADAGAPRHHRPGRAAHAPATATTDVRFFHLYGHIPSTCYGPRGANIHGVDEWVSISSLQQVTTVLALYIARWCGLEALAA
jgi:acetylornithine deacetylase